MSIYDQILEEEKLLLEKEKPAKKVSPYQAILDEEASLIEASNIKREYVEQGGKPEDVYSPERAKILVEQGPSALAAEPPLKRVDGSIAGPTLPTEEALAKGLIEKRAEPAVQKAMNEGVNTVSSGYDQEKGVGFAVGRGKDGKVVRVEEKPRVNIYQKILDEERQQLEKTQGLQPMSEYQRPDPANDDPTFVGALGRGAIRSALPTAAGIAGGAATGAAIGAVMTGPAAPVGAAIGGLAGGIAAAMGAEKLQDYAIEKIVSPETKQAIDEQFAKDAEKQPVASFAGQVAPSFALFRPSPSNLAKAGSFAKQIMSGQVTKEALETPAVREQASNLLNVAFGAGTQTGLEAYGQLERGEFDPLRLGASVVIGALQTEPTRLGKATITEPMARMEEAIRARKATPQDAQSTDMAEPKAQQEVATTEPQNQEQAQPEDPFALTDDRTEIATQKGFANPEQKKKPSDFLVRDDGMDRPDVLGERPPDVIDYIKELGGIMPKGRAETEKNLRLYGKKGGPSIKRLQEDGAIAEYDGATGINAGYRKEIAGTIAPDEMAQMLLDNYGVGDGSVDGLWGSVSKAIESRNKNKLSLQEFRKAGRQEKAFVGNVLKPKNQNKESVTAGQFYKGDEFVAGGEDFRVSDISPDTGAVTLTDGDKYGTQTVRPDTSLFTDTKPVPPNSKQSTPSSEPPQPSQPPAKAQPAPQPAPEPRSTQAKQNPIIELGRNMKTQAGRFLKTGGNLPKEVFGAMERAEFNLNETKLRADYAVDDFKRAVKTAYGKELRDLPETEIIKLNDALANDEIRGLLPQEVGNAIGNMRNMIDEYSTKLMPLVDEKLRAKIDANKGVYFYRSYEKFLNPKYKGGFDNLPVEAQNKLIALVKERLGPSATQQEVNGMIEYLQSPEADSPFAQIGSKLTKDLSVLSKRKEIPEEIRLLWGEIKDPRVNFLQSVERIGAFVETHNMLKTIRDAGMGKFLFDRPIEGYSTKIVSDGSKVSSPLNMFVDGQTNPVYTSPEIAQALKDTFGGGSKSNDVLARLGRFYLKVNALSKYTKTVLSLQTQVRNILGNIWFLVREGYIFSPEIVTAFNSIKGAIAASGAKLGTTRNFLAREYAAKLTRLGIFGQSVRANELAAYFREANIGSGADLIDSLPVRGITKSVKLASKLYELGDAIPKALAFEIELNRAKAAYPNASLEAQERIAADTVLDSLPTYSRIPMAGDILRRQPFVGAFVSFPLEVVRTTYNFIGRTSEQINSQNPTIRQAGFRRLVGGLAAYVGLTGLAEGIRMLSGVTDEEDKASRRMDAPWDKYSTKIYFGKDESGNTRFINISYLDPSNYLRDPLLAVWKRDGNWQDKFKESFKTFFEPFVGEQILTSKFLDVARNKKAITGGMVFNPQDPIGKKALDIATHIGDAFVAGTISSGIRVYRGYTGEVTKTGRAYDPLSETLAAVLGQRIVSQDPRQSLMFEATKFKRALNEASSIYSAAYYDRSRSGVAERPEAYQRMVDARRGIFLEMSRSAKAAMTLGVPRGEVMRIIRNQGVSEENVRGIVNGFVPMVSPVKREKRFANSK